MPRIRKIIAATRSVGPKRRGYTNSPDNSFNGLSMKLQARALGLETRWHEVAQGYHDANLMLGRIIKVTLSSKLAGDLVDDMRAKLSGSTMAFKNAALKLRAGTFPQFREIFSGFRQKQMAKT